MTFFHIIKSYLKFFFFKSEVLKSNCKLTILFKNIDLMKYFDGSSEKRELSSETSTSSDDPRKIRDGSLDDSNNPDDVFTEGVCWRIGLQ